MHSIGVFFSAYCFGLLKYSRKSKRFTALVACVPLVQKDSWALSILISMNRTLGRMKSSRFIRTKVDFHGNLHAFCISCTRNLSGTYFFRGQANVLVQHLYQSNCGKLYIQFWLWPGLFEVVCCAACNKLFMSQKVVVVSTF